MVGNMTTTRDDAHLTAFGDSFYDHESGQEGGESVEFRPLPVRSERKQKKNWILVYIATTALFVTLFVVAFVIISNQAHEESIIEDRIASLQKINKTLTEGIADLKSEMNKLKVEISGQSKKAHEESIIEDRIAALEKINETLTEDITDLKGEMKKLKVERSGQSKKILLLQNALLSSGWYTGNLTNGRFYKLYRTKLPWDEADRKCKAIGAQLATGIRDEKIRRDIISNVLRRVTANIWVGLAEPMDDANWTWVDGIPANRTDSYWDSATGQPQNISKRKDCGDMEYRKWTIHDRPCINPFFYLCEM